MLYDRKKVHREKKYMCVLLEAAQFLGAIKMEAITFHIWGYKFCV
jgi:hypothetical protein